MIRVIDMNPKINVMPLQVHASVTWDMSAPLIWYAVVIIMTAWKNRKITETTLATNM